MSDARSRRSTAHSASRTTPTLCVLVSAISLASMPASRIHASPVSSPLPLSRWEPAKAGSHQAGPGRGRTTVTPVRTGPSAHLQRTLAAHDGRVPDANALDVRDRVERARGARADREAELAKPRHRTRSTS